MKALSLYSGGCDGLSLAASWVGMETAAFCECDEACREQLRRRHPGKHIFHYDTEVSVDALRKHGIEPGTIDIILASPPCQCASVAGKRLGAADKRNRWPECLRILRDVRPRWFLGENVPGLLSVNNGRLFGAILGELAALGYDVGWCVFGAGDLGAPHKRDRLCLVAHHPGVRRSARRSQLQRQRGEAEPAGIGGKVGAVAHAERGELWDDLHHHRQIPREIHPFADTGLPGGELGHTTSAGLPDGGTIPLGKPGPLPEPQRPGRRPAEPGLGGLFDGISARLAAHQWPAPRGAEQYPWEPPRTVRGMKGRAALIKMLGNAVVPQWAAVPLAAIAELEGREQL